MGELILIDGGVGTSLWEKSDDKSPVWTYNFNHPELVIELANEMVEAGAKQVAANTFAANRGAVEHAKYEHTVTEIVQEAMKLAYEGVKSRAKIALSIGPLTGMLEPIGDVTKEECYEWYCEMVDAAMNCEYKPDVVYLQTFMDLEMMKLAAKAVKRYDIPLMASMSFTKYNPKKGGRTMYGNTPKQIAEQMAEFNPIGLGLNCSNGPVETLEIVKEFTEASDIPVVFKPNAGMPMQEGGSDFDYDTFAKDVAIAADYGVTYFGGCCGASAKYIAALKTELDKRI